MIVPDLTTALVALSTLATLLYIGLGFLPRPSRASATWSLSFAGTMVGSYAWAGGNALDADALRAAASGLMLGMIALVWTGLRMWRGAARSYAPVAAAFTVLAAAVLALLAETDLFLLAIRVMFLGSAVFSALTILELARLGPLLRDEILPLALISAGHIMMAVLGSVSEVVRLSTGGPAEAVLETNRTLNTLGALLYLSCAVVTLLLLTRLQQPSAAAVPSSFRTVALDRLQRAQEAHDPWWSLLVVRLDDPEALREASSTNAYDQIVGRFAAVLRGALPADADIDQRSASEFVVLLPRPVGAVRQVLAQLLEKVADAGADSPLAVRLSASAGWAQVEVVGYALSDLETAAERAADEAQQRGGDQWNRAVGVA
ncbi:hypothetical protein [Microbacterium sp.]|uniref:hypothetical protein n=1 Tax=Microbacterium sp. TaxID=51671 RepID=UPI0039E4B833